MNAIDQDTSRVECISPVMAEYWLTQNMPFNRKVSIELVNRLAEAISNGYWCKNGETIKFNNKNQLIDGQHRLHAIVKSGISVESYVVRGVSDERAFLTIDDGKKRSLSCSLNSTGKKNTKTTAGIGKLYYQLTHCKDINCFRISNVSLENIILFEFVNSLPNMDEAVRMAMCLQKICPASVMGTALLVFMEIDLNQTCLFFDMMRDNEYPSSNHPIKILRDQLIFNKHPRTEKLALIFKTWNYMQAGKTVKNIRWRPANGEKFPVPAGWMHA